LPVPKPQANEEKDDYISRCISSISNEYEQDQATAICFNTWRETKKENMDKNVIKNIQQLKNLLYK